MSAIALAEARSLKREATERLKRAQSTGADRAAVARAALKELNSARALLQLAPAGASVAADREIEEINALIYWTRKMMPLEGVGAPPPSAEPPSGVSRDFLARKAYETVALYAKSHADDHFLIAVMYFEVADRFSGTEYSLKAQKLSLDHMQRSIATAGAASASTKAAQKTYEETVKKAITESATQAGLKETTKAALREQFAVVTYFYPSTMGS